MKAKDAFLLIGGRRLLECFLSPAVRAGAGLYPFGRGGRRPPLKCARGLVYDVAESDSF